MVGGFVDTSRIDIAIGDPTITGSLAVRVIVAFTGTWIRSAPPAEAVTAVPVTGAVSWATNEAG
jgi:hypothetical protein